VSTRLRFDDVQEGDELPTREFVLSKTQVREYARAGGLWTPRFTDDEGARQEGLPGMITPGNMSLGLLATFLESWAGAVCVRRLGATFRGLVIPDRTVRLRGVVTQKEASRRTVEVDVWLESDEGERGVIGTATLALS